MGWFKKKDPICGMKQEKDSGMERYGHWFCAKSCLEAYEKGLKKTSKKSCCCH